MPPEFPPLRFYESITNEGFAKSFSFSRLFHTVIPAKAGIQ
jgi:hypothetical protein